LNKTIQGVVKVLEYIVTILFFFIASTAFLQVLLRYGFNRSLHWAHDLDIQLMIWTVWLCAPIGLYQKAHLRVNFLEGYFSRKTQRILNVLFDCFTFLFLILLGIKGVDVIQSVAGMTLLSLPIPTGLMFAAAPVGATLMIFVSIPELVRDLKDLSNPGEGRRRN